MKPLFTLLRLAFFFSLACAFQARAAEQLSPGMERFYRAVYVLQSFGGPAAREQIDIPGKVRSSDAAESLINHPDKGFALREATEELNALSLTMPEALLFAAYGNLALNDGQRAVDQLRRYVESSAYREEPYVLLCKTLYSMRDFVSLGEVVREWESKVPMCLESRLLFAFAYMYHEGKYTEARQYVTESQPCGGWRAKVFAAKAARAMGQKNLAENEVRTIRAENPESDKNIELFWERIKPQESFF